MLREKATSQSPSKEAGDRAELRQELFDVKNKKPWRTGKWKQTLRETEGRKPEERNARLTQQFRCCGMACLLDRYEASKIRRDRLKANESVSPITIDLAVLGKPKERERLRSRRAWEALRLSA